MALGHLGLAETDKAERYFALAAEMDNNHQGVQHMLKTNRKS